MIRLMLFIAALGCFGLLEGVQAQDAATFIREGERLEANLNEKGAYEMFKAVLQKDGQNIYALYKCSELCSRIGSREPNATARNNYYEAAVKYATAALKVNGAHSGANCAMAIALGRISLEKGGKEKVNAAKQIKKHVDQALASDPRNYKAWHVLGRWHFELSNLNFIEKGAVKVFFGGLPKASLQDAIAAYEKAQALSTAFLLNYLELAKACHKAGQKAKAVQLINTMLQFGNHTEDDETTKWEGRKLLKEWK